MNILLKTYDHLFKIKLDLLVIPTINRKLPKRTISQNHPLFKEIARHIDLGDIKTKAGSLVLFYPSGKDMPKRVALLELGKQSPAIHALQPALQPLNALCKNYKNCGILIPPTYEAALTPLLVRKLYEWSYTNNEHKTKPYKDEPYQLETMVLFSPKNLAHFVRWGQILGQAIVTIKELAGRPANLLTPSVFAEHSKKLAKQEGLNITILGEPAMQKQGMGGILSVSRGSEEEAKLIILDYNPRGKKTIALVGKGITFDSGGISIKPSKDMDEMKYDMTGGATVLALLYAVKKLKLPYRVVGIIAAAENLPSGKAVKPGDVIKTLSGKTVEVLNTDAEGRLVLADALTYAQKYYKPRLIIDIATLTGAIVVALGNKITGAFGNTKRYNKSLLAASKISGEPVHFMPLFRGYGDEVKSKIADLANIGKHRTDAIIAALFLEQFIEHGTPWIHLDIAGTAWDNNGATGVMLGTIIECIKKIKL